MRKVKGIILDWAGTTVDFGCFAPMHAFIRAFEEKGLELTNKEVREPMGLAKLDHIKALLELSRIKKLWQKKFGQSATEKDIKELYDRFEIVLMDSLKDFADPIPHVLDAVKFLRKKNIKIGSTTGYTAEMMTVVASEAKKQGYFPDSLVTPEQVGGLGRPYPYMIFKNMQNLELLSTASVVKIGDTCSDIKEGLHAGVWTVGCVTGSSELGLSKSEFQQLSSKEKKDLMTATKKTFLKSGAHYVIENMEEVPNLIEKINKLLAEGNCPGRY